MPGALSNTPYLTHFLNWAGLRQKTGWARWASRVDLKFYLFILKLGINNNNNSIKIQV